VESKTSDIDGYLNWAADHRIALPPQTTAANALSKLQSTNFSDIPSVLELCTALQDCAPIPLVEDKQRQYFVVPRSSILNGPTDTSVPSVTAPVAASPAPISQAKMVTHPAFLALTQTKSTTTTTGTATTTPALPKYVFPLGIVFFQDPAVTEQDGQSLIETTYTAVVDVVASDHPVWLVYNRHPYDELAGEPITVDPADTPLVFPGVGSTNFDSSKAIASLKSWSISPARPTLAEFQKLASGAKGTGEVVPTNVLIADLEKAMLGSVQVAGAAA
jgi:hypothetical protein